MITKVTYARLYNLGNYENERLEVEVTVEDSSAAAVGGAWEDACAAVEEQHARLQADRDAAAQRAREEYEQRERERREKWEEERRQRAAAKDVAPTAAQAIGETDGDQPF